MTENDVAVMTFERPEQALGLRIIQLACQQAVKGDKESVEFVKGKGIEKIIDGFGLDVRADFVRGWLCSLNAPTGDLTGNGL